MLSKQSNGLNFNYFIISHFTLARILNWIICTFSSTEKAVGVDYPAHCQNAFSRITIAKGLFSPFIFFLHVNRRNVVSTWSSGTGGAGIIGSFSYALLKSLGVSSVNTMLLMLIVPLIEGAAFWILLRNPTAIPKKDSEASFQISPDEEYGSDGSSDKFTIGDKIRFIPTLLKYMLPLGLVYLFEYFINQGLFELIFFDNIWIDQSTQYRWLHVDYQIGVFISRSSVNVFQLNRIWIMSVFQFANILLLLTEVVTFVTPSIWIVFVVVLWEGLLGGGAYVNTFYRMSKEIPANRMKFAMGIVPVSDAIGIALAGALAMPAHNALCQLPLPSRS